MSDRASLNGEPSEAEQPRLGDDKAPPGEDNERPAFDFKMVLPPTLPHKTVPIQ